MTTGPQCSPARKFAAAPNSLMYSGASRASSIHRGEAGGDAVSVCDPLVELPGRYQFVADVAVDFTARRCDRFGEIDDEAVEQAVKGERAEPLGECGRSLHVDEEKHARFDPRPVIAAGDEI